MASGFVRRVLAIGIVVLLPAAASAQEAVLTGTVTDSTGAVLPGVTVTALLQATGNTFEGVTDDAGIYRVLRPDATIVARNSLFAPAQNRTDLRLQQRIPLGGRVSVDGIAEVFNMFNRPNYAIGTQESSPNYLTNTSAQARTMQFGFRLQF